MAASPSAYNVSDSADHVGLPALASLISGLVPQRLFASVIAILRTQACRLLRALSGAAQPRVTRFRS